MEIVGLEKILGWKFEFAKLFFALKVTEDNKEMIVAEKILVRVLPNLSCGRAVMYRSLRSLRLLKQAYPNNVSSSCCCYSCQ